MSNEVPLLELEPGEVGLLLVMWITSGYMFIESYSFTGLDGLYPRIFSIAVFVLVSMLLFRNLLPEPLSQLVEGGGSLGVGGATADSDADDPDEQQADDESRGMTRKTAGVTTLTGGYMLFGYLVGLMWVTPIYVFAYLRWAEYSWTFSGGLALVMFGVAYGMRALFYFPIEQGYLHDLLLIVVPVVI
ncbi:hypothetical protein [Natrarchaeobius oligotrophus]|uniref:Tripartite tricarboxylate transporter TctB family protein n=1 Tax=Natrarchaeobius chitinivorans TaxID=1679083 RepID=A0A3N6MF62_NATCH|nr:hypothetical protein [Natrarchaeobius chitinivorans]RQH02579.1 hypothetical protein EA472_04595 [Natrarchaeobius chitinivorans]